jgi:murein DD-endopeptidase MepM/ murein hydrolase activator NlpD
MRLLSLGLIVAVFNCYSIFSQELTDTIPNDEIEENIDTDTSTDSIPKETLNMSFDTTKVPAANLYNCWSNNTVNPYGIDLAKKSDTTVIDLSGYVHPIAGRITSNFGWRRWRWHYGTDIKLQIGDTVRCSFDGMVRIAKRSRTFGNYIVVRHCNGLETIYGHLSKIKVGINQTIKAGEMLGLGGSTGRSTGPHLHYEVRYLGNSINPNDIIDFYNDCLKNDSLCLCQIHFDYLNEIRKVRFHVVRRGDTLGGIALRYGITVTHLCQLNKISRKKLLRIGQRIRYT